MPKLMTVQAIQPYILKLEYSDGIQGQVDMTKLAMKYAKYGLENFEVFSKIRTD